MRQSHTTALKSERRRSRRESVNTAVGIAAERVTLAHRERERQTSLARVAARHLEERPVTR